MATAALLAAPVAAVRADGPAVSTFNGKLSTEGGATGGGGASSGAAITNGSITTPLGHAFGLQVDGSAGTAFNEFFGGGTTHLFWRDPQIGMFGPVASLAAGGGFRLGWYGAEAEAYAGIFTFGAWGGYHDVVNGAFGVSANSGFYGGSLKVYPMPDLALAIGATSEFGRVSGTGGLEFQPDLFARHNVSFFINGDVGDNSTYSVTAGVRLYFGPDKSLIRRHREDDPPTGAGSAPFDQVVQQLATAQWLGVSAQTAANQAAPFHQWLYQTSQGQQGQQGLQIQQSSPPWPPSQSGGGLTLGN